MPLTHAEIVTRIQDDLGDTAEEYFTIVRITEKIGSVIKLISQKVPYETDRTYPGKYTTDGTTRDITLSDWDYGELVRIPQLNGLEYPIGLTPQRFRDCTPRGKVVTIELYAIPAASEDVYIYPDRLHILQSAIGTTDTAGAIKTQAAAGVTSLALKSLGTGTVNKYTKLTIAGDTTVYTVTATATIGTNEATVYIYPELQALAAADAVVTLALADSTLSPALEEVLIKWTTGALVEDSSIAKMPNFSPAAGWQAYTQKGQNMIAEAKADLAQLVTAGRRKEHSIY